MSEVRLIDAIQLHRKIMDDAEYDFSKKLSLAQCLLYVENASTIEAKPIRCGQWILVDKSRFTGRRDLKCSVCGNYFRVYINETLNAGRGDANFCPNCGAKLDGWRY